MVMTASTDPPSWDSPHDANGVAGVDGYDARAIEFSVNGLATRLPEYSAHKRFSLGQRIGIGVTIVGIIAAFATNPIATGTVGMTALMVLYVGMLWMRIDLAVRGRGDQRVRFTDEELAAIDRDSLPTFSILVPAYKEPQVMPHLVANLAALVYPRHKLEIKLLLEEDDEATIAAAAALNLTAPFEVIIVPPVGPRTKPKALNYALLGCRGDIICIYDAEDHPDPDQLMKVAATFAKLGERVGCVQAELAYYNANENLITRWFAVEYRMWFTQFLPALARTNAAIPLGGTSNHMRRELLIKLGAWDPYNVTEDADLGIRAAAVGLKVGITESTTWEEACSEWKSWIRQRTRWIKGYMVTALVHTRRPRQLWRETGWRGYLGLIGLIAGTPAMFLACPLVWGFWLFTFLGGSIPGFHIAPWLQIAMTANLIIGNGAMVVLAAVAALRRKAYDLVPFSLLNPAYWILHSIAAWRALYQLIVSPSHWEKTPHGIVHGPDAQRAAESA